MFVSSALPDNVPSDNFKTIDLVAASARTNADPECSCDDQNELIDHTIETGRIDLPKDEPNPDYIDDGGFTDPANPNYRIRSK